MLIFPTPVLYNVVGAVTEWWKNAREDEAVRLTLVVGPDGKVSFFCLGEDRFYFYFISLWLVLVCFIMEVKRRERPNPNCFMKQASSFESVCFSPS